VTQVSKSYGPRGVLFWTLLGMSVGCAQKPVPDAAERTRLSEWRSMAASVRSASALAELRKRARSGMVEAQSALGQALCQQSDLGLRGEGLAWLRSAANSRDSAALLALGKLELSGGSVQPDYHAALLHLRAAAEQGEPRASYYLGVMARSGYGEPADHAAAAQLLGVAADHGFPQAMFLLANAYREGDGVPRDEQRALALYQKAAELDHPESIQALAMAYQNGELGLARDQERFRSELAELAHAQRHAPSAP